MDGWNEDQTQPKASQLKSFSNILALPRVMPKIAPSSFTSVMGTKKAALLISGLIRTIVLCTIITSLHPVKKISYSIKYFRI